MAIRRFRSSMLDAGWTMCSEANDHSLLDPEGRSSFTRKPTNQNHPFAGRALDLADQVPAALSLA